MQNAEWRMQNVKCNFVAPAVADFYVGLHEIEKE